MALFTQQAKGRSDWSTYERCIRFVEQAFQNADGELEGALYVGFLEHIDFEGPRGKEAWGRLGPELQAAWKRITTDNARRGALPHRGSARGK